jgi:phage-related protein
MKLTINGIDIGGSVYNIDKIQGLGKAPIRATTQNFSGAPGGRINGTPQYSPRVITIQGWFKHDNSTAHEAARDALDAALPINANLSATVTRFSGTQGSISARVTDLEMDYWDTGAGKGTDYKLDLFCGDPLFYIGGIQTVTLALFAPGGVVLPVILPAVFAAGSSDNIAANSGLATISPTITLTGSATNPTFTNADNGYSVSVPVTMSSGDVLFIDMKNHIITLNGGSVLGLATSKQWFSLMVGTNHIRYTTTNAADSGVAVMTWQNALESM